MSLETIVLIVFLVLAGGGMAMALVAVELGIRDLAGSVEGQGK